MPIFHLTQSCTGRTYRVSQQDTAERRPPGDRAGLALEGTQLDHIYSPYLAQNNRWRVERDNPLRKPKMV